MEIIMTLVSILTMEANTGATQIFQTKAGKTVTNPLALYKTGRHQQMVILYHFPFVRMMPLYASSSKNTATRILTLQNVVKKLVENAFVRMLLSLKQKQNARSIKNGATRIHTLRNVVKKLVENALSNHIDNIIFSNCFNGLNN